MYIRNAWYVAGFGHELESGKLISRTFMDERVVMYRKADGSPAALQDRCPHRFVPLHIGKVKGDSIQCGYHGLEFGADGACSHNPHGDGKISSNMRVKSYPMAEQDGILWIWMGEAEKADPATIVRFPSIKLPYKTLFGYMRVEANYQLVNDNLLDLSHAQYVHPLFQGDAGLQDFSPPEGGFEENDAGFIARVTFRNLPPTPLAAGLGAPDRVDSWVDTYWFAPSMIDLDIGARRPGAERGEGDDVHFPSLHLLTPETEGSTHYFWTFMRNVRPDDEELSAWMYAGVEQAFAGEDKPIIEMQQRGLGAADLMEFKPVLLQTDMTAVRARRIVQSMVEAERQGIAAE
jgi:phenylpropionate dioxygenase-like ring-hydroxylating dioxygenase large terminal subunit